MATLQQVPSVASAASHRSAALVAPVRPALAMRRCFKSAAAAPMQTSRAGVATRVAAMDLDPLVVGISKDAQRDMLKIPKGYHWYETMVILRTTLNEEERDRELAKFEAFLNKEECLNINALVRGSSRMAYHIKNNWEGVYVVYTYAARRQTAKAVQKLLSTPDVGSEDNILRHITFCKY